MTLICHLILYIHPYITTHTATKTYSFRLIFATAALHALDVLTLPPFIIMTSRLGVK